MQVKIGDHIFDSKEALKTALSSGRFKEYDCSVQLREAHDAQMVFDKVGRKIKATQEELRLYWKEQMKNHSHEKLKEIKVGEKVINPWVVK